MVNVNNYSNRYKPSVHTGRQNVNYRAQERAYMKAYGAYGGGSIFPNYQQQTISYSAGPSNAYMTGQVIGQTLNMLPSVLQSGAGLVNTIKGWFK
ncbi:MAG: hypothetical protein NC191_08480 [Muribaculaceae bacterium]|nr:hypothetical protein [Muribaculaceae bacterium]